jgi:hypothetical protein
VLGLVTSVALACSPLSREEGKELVLLAPAAGHTPSAMFKRVEAGEFVYRVADAGGHLIGWYAVNPLTATVRDWIADGLPVVTTPGMADRQRQLRDRHCRPS